MRLEELQPTTRVSLGRLIAEQAKRAPHEECLLFEDRVRTNAAVADSVHETVRGLIAVGIRQGAHVGVLMDTCPDAVTVIVALSRLGAVAVLLPPDDDLAAAVQLCEVADVVADSSHLAAAAATGARVLVCGRGGATGLAWRASTASWRWTAWTNRKCGCRSGIGPTPVWQGMSPLCSSAPPAGAGWSRR